MAKDKRHFNILSLDTILYVVLFLQFQNLKLAKCLKKTVHAMKILSVPHFFHGQSPPPETLAQCAEATFFSGEIFVWNSPNGEPVENKTNTMDASMMSKLLGLMCFFLDLIEFCSFFSCFCWMIELGSCTRLPSLEATSKSWKKMGERKL